jgi:hypothetical protein
VAAALLLGFQVADREVAFLAVAIVVLVCCERIQGVV